MYSCRFCIHQTDSLMKHLEHHKFHSNVNTHKSCGWNKCKKIFRTEASLKMHILRKHNISYRHKLHKTISQNIVNKDAKFVCSISYCLKQHSRYQLFMKHLKEHLSRSECVQCPLPHCRKKYSNVSSFTSHLSRCHSNDSGIDIEAERGELTLDETTNMECDQSINDIASCSGYEISTYTHESDKMQITSEFKRKNFADLYLINMAQMFLKLEAQLLVPASTIQYFVAESGNIDNLRMDLIKNQLRNKLLASGMSNIEGEEILKTVLIEDPFTNCHLKLKTDFLRKKLYKDRFTYVEPIQCSLGIVKGKERFFHYVPIIETLKALFKNMSLDITVEIPERNDTDILKDFTDGNAFLGNAFFNRNRISLRLILYQDSFEIVNPIGPARIKHKLLAVYLCLGNLPDFLRAHINTIQLVALCNEKFFDHDKVYGKIVDDLTIIENDGIEISPTNFIKGSVAFISTDNLGGHGLGGFVENFSTTQYFCRYCLITRKDFWREPISMTENEEYEAENGTGNDEFEEGDEFEVIGECRNVEGSNDELEDGESGEDEEFEDHEIPVDDKESNKDEEFEDDEELEDEECGRDEESEENDGHEEIANNPGESVCNYYVPISYKTRTVASYNESLKYKKGNSNNYQGIKFDSVFNRLKGYHVCQPGLPPCFGHDLLEGIVAFDMFQMIVYFVSKRWFSYELLNKKIDSFKYSSHDRQDKPAKIPEKGKGNRIVGGAWQILVLLRLFPLLVGHKIDPDDDVWSCLLNLTEIVEIVCAPEIHKSFVSHLKFLIDEYLSERKKLFPAVKLRPKHHYLTHYPELILQFGPLIKVFTLRFESKHTFFKRAMRVLKCYKNVTSTLSEKHELLQSFLRSGAGLRCELQLNQEHEFHMNLYSENIQKAVRDAKFCGKLTECSSAVFRGTQYKKGDAVAIRQEAYEYNVEMGKIVIILCNNEECLYLIVEVLETTFQPRLRLYELGHHIRYECLSLKKLLSYSPLHIYVQGITPYVKVKHALASTSLC